MKKLLVGLLLLGTGLPAQARWTSGYTQQQLLDNPARRAQFVHDYVAHEAPFVKLVHQPQSGLVYDGINLSPETGWLKSFRQFSAPSKECLDLGLLCKVLEKDPLALELMTPQAARSILAQKIRTYQSFTRRHPGYGGYLPWYIVGERIEPTPDWKNEIPGLDNGEWVWAMLLVERQLRLSGDGELAEQYRDYIEGMRDRAVPLFYDAKRKLIRADVGIDPSDPQSPPKAGKHLDYLTGEHGVHEGVMQVLFVDLLGRHLPADGERAIWNATTMKRVETRWGTTWQGYWGSAHESWAYLFLPLRQIPEFAQLFRIREAIRSNNAVDRHYPGFATSALEPGGPGYLDGAGIEGVGSQPIRNNQLFTLYGAFPSLLDPASRPDALAWVLNMLSAPRMEGPLGAGEAGTNDGRKTTAAKTVDGTYPNLLALMGGLERESAAMMRERGIYDHFVRIMKGEYAETFAGAPIREPAKMVPPEARVPMGLESDYQVSGDSL